MCVLGILCVSTSFRRTDELRCVECELQMPLHQLAK